MHKDQLITSMVSRTGLSVEQVDGCLRALMNILQEPSKPSPGLFGDEDGVRFWLCVEDRVRGGVLLHDNHIKINGGELFVRWKTVVAAYQERHLERYQEHGLMPPRMLAVLKNRPEYLRTQHNFRFGPGVQSSSFVFDLTKLPVTLPAKKWQP
ncbi:MAG TPA: hypothetical protein PLB89_05295 [Flavobacteriales bacterium]|nr:hypothetical protein [Flavobacteriales bacterium]